MPATPAVDALRERGAWSSSLDKFAEWGPDWIERCARMTNNLWTTGVLPVKWIQLICIVLNAACTHRNEPAVGRHVQAALNAGATRDEILDTFKGVSELGIHSSPSPCRSCSRKPHKPGCSRRLAQPTPAPHPSSIR